MMPNDKFRGTLEWTGPARDTMEEALADMRMVDAVLDELFKDHKKEAKRIPGTDAWHQKSKG